MTKADVIVETIYSISPPGEKRASAAEPPPSLVTVKLHGGQLAQLDVSMPHSKAWAGILDSMQRAKQAVYLKIDPQTGSIVDLLVPLAVKVVSMKPANREGDIEVELVISAARHYLRSANPDFKNMLGTLEKALKTGMPLLVTESRDRLEIVDVRLLPETVAAPTYLAAPLTGPATGESGTVQKQTRPKSGKGGAK
jgi:hypothetical protein